MYRRGVAGTPLRLQQPIVQRPQHSRDERLDLRFVFDPTLSSANYQSMSPTSAAAQSHLTTRLSGLWGPDSGSSASTRPRPTAGLAILIITIITLHFFRRFYRVSPLHILQKDIGC
jgi:hypothetical protein